MWFTRLWCQTRLNTFELEETFDWRNVCICCSNVIIALNYLLNCVPVEQLSEIIFFSWYITKTGNLRSLLAKPEDFKCQHCSWIHVWKYTYINSGKLSTGKNAWELEDEIQSLSVILFVIQSWASWWPEKASSKEDAVTARAGGGRGCWRQSIRRLMNGLRWHNITVICPSTAPVAATMANGSIPFTETNNLSTNRTRNQIQEEQCMYRWSESIIRSLYGFFAGMELRVERSLRLWFC